MTLVERLRDRAKFQFNTCDALMFEAANRIEELEAEIRNLEDAHDELYWDAYHRD